jgi:hypothetical protein
LSNFAQTAADNGRRLRSYVGTRVSKWQRQTSSGNMPMKQCVGPFNPKAKKRSKPISTLRIHGRKLRCTASTFLASTRVHQRPGQPCSTTDKRVSRPSGALKLGSFKKGRNPLEGAAAPSVKGGPLVRWWSRQNPLIDSPVAVIRAHGRSLLAAIGRVRERLRNRWAIAVVLNDLLLFSCLTALVTAIVIAAATLII